MVKKESIGWGIGIVISIGGVFFVWWRLYPARSLKDAVWMALVSGLGVIIVSARLKKWKPLLVFEILRDVGIALLIAGLVSIVYERSTRAIAKREEDIAQREKTVELFNTINEYLVGKSVWQEINTAVYRAPQLRRNVNIRIRLSRNSILPDRKPVSLPDHYALLWMEYSYDLYPLSNESWEIPIHHVLDFQMRNKELDLPRFERVEIIKGRGPLDALSKVFTHETLTGMVDDQGGIKLELDKLKSDLGGLTADEHVRIITERYEIVSTPGQYRLTVPMLTARALMDTHTITISIESFPDDIKPQVDSYYSRVQFQPDSSKRVWTFDGVMLPGQGFSIVFSAPNKSLPAGQEKLKIGITDPPK